MLSLGSRSRSPSAALVLGILSGALAAISVIPTIVPLSYRIASSEDAAEVSRLETAASAFALIHSSDVGVPDNIARSLHVSVVQLISEDGENLATWGNLPDGLDLLSQCNTKLGSSSTAERGWLVACRPQGDLTIITGRRPGARNTAYVGYLVAGLALMVGISTALGVLQLLSPISEMSRALERVKAGERGVRVANTGLAELDDLIERLNAATQAMEDREQAVISRFQVVQELARLVAHEVRNPLQSLELLTSLVASEDQPSARQELAGSIHEEIRTLEAVVRRLLKDSEGQGALRPHRIPTSIPDLIHKVITFRKFEARRLGIQLEAGEITNYTLKIDRILVSRALENLVQNAMQAVPKQNGRVRLSAFDNDTHVCIVVDDNGTGVDPALGESIYQSDISGRQEGTGLGLALVQGVLQAHNGYVEHRQSPLGGARFRAWLPFDSPSEEEGLAHPSRG